MTTKRSPLIFHVVIVFMDTLIPWSILTCHNPYMVLLLGCIYENIPLPHTPWYDIHNTQVKQEII